MGLWKIAAAGLLAGMLPMAAAQAEPIPLRGVVEGFYGTPWGQKERMDILSFCREHGFNAYLYAPKDDPYHRARWREPYPKKKLRELSKLVRTAKEKQVKFIFAVSPGLDLHYTILKGGTDRELLRKKLEAVYDIGVRDFAVFFDDITELHGEEQAELLNWLEENFVEKHGDVSSLITVPTEYYRKNMQEEDGEVKPYTRDFSAGLHASILPLYTGEGVVCKGISEEELEAANSLYGRSLGIWWNYPVTDYMEAKLALGPVENLPKHAEIPAIFFNPMKYEELSKIALATGADYANDPEHYDPQISWERAIEKQYGKLARDMKLFAEQSQHLENNWAFVGRADGAALRASMDALWSSWPDGEEADVHWESVRQQTGELLGAVGRLMKELPESSLSECCLQLRLMERIAEADGTALELLKSLRDDDRKKAKRLFASLKKKRGTIQRMEKKALVSDKAARAFLDEVLAYAAPAMDKGRR